MTEIHTAAELLIRPWRAQCAQLETQVLNLSANCKAAVDQAAEYAHKYGEALARITSLERELAKAKAKARTPGTVEVCEAHRFKGCIEHERDGDTRQCIRSTCPLKRAHSPAAKEADSE